MKSVPLDEDSGLTFEEVVVLKLHDRPPQAHDSSDNRNLLDDLESIRLYQMELIVEACAYCKKLCK